MKGKKKKKQTGQRGNCGSNLTVFASLEEGGGLMEGNLEYGDSWGLDVQAFERLMG